MALLMIANLKCIKGSIFLTTNEDIRYSLQQQQTTNKLKEKAGDEKYRK